MIFNKGAHAINIPKFLTLIKNYLDIDCLSLINEKRYPLTLDSLSLRLNLICRLPTGGLEIIYANNSIKV
jgi:hypothetical protein